MEWIVKIEQPEEEERKQRIRITFDPLQEQIHVYGEVRVKNNKWFIFSEIGNEMKLNLERLQATMELTVTQMRKRLKEYNNLDKGFSVLKLVAFEEPEEQEEV